LAVLTHVVSFSSTRQNVRHVLGSAAGLISEMPVKRAMSKPLMIMVLALELTCPLLSRAGHAVGVALLLDPQARVPWPDLTLRTRRLLAASNSM